MLLLSEILSGQGGLPTRSAEFFPPAGAAGERNLLGGVAPALAGAGFHFCSVTHGAGGGGRAEQTLGLVDRIQREVGIRTLMHLNRIGMSRSGVEELVRRAMRRGISCFLALGGDEPEGGAAPSDIRHAAEIVELIKGLPEGGACVGVAGFPEGNAAYGESSYSNWRWLVEKIRRGADFVITQMFFDNRNFLRFRDFVTGLLGREVPILAGVMPINPEKPLGRFLRLTGARVPGELRDGLERHAGDAAGLREFGADYCARQVEGLHREGVSGVHYYCLNRAEPTLTAARAVARLTA